MMKTIMLNPEGTKALAEIEDTVKKYFSLEETTFQVPLSPISNFGSVLGVLAGANCELRCYIPQKYIEIKEE